MQRELAEFRSRQRPRLEISRHAALLDRCDRGALPVVDRAERFARFGRVRRARTTELARLLNLDAATETMPMMRCNAGARCKYWSELIARAGGGTTNPAGEVEAMCLNPDSPHHLDYTIANQGCDAGEEGEPVDLGF